MAIQPLPFTVDIQTVRKAGMDEFKKISRWARKAHVSVPTLYKFLDGGRVKFDTAEKIIKPTSVPFESVVRVNGRRLVA